MIPKFETWHYAIERRVEAVVILDGKARMPCARAVHGITGRNEIRADDGSRR
jgi:hypothetical protein